ncbi:MAG: gamma-glutamyltransferase [Actinomycetes bacterium]
MRPGVAAGHPVTAQAGAQALQAGGTAADAAVAMILTSCAAETIFTGLSGGGFAIYHEAATATTTCVDFFVGVPGLGGRTPGPGTPIEVIFVGQALPYDIGPPTVAVPGLPAGAHHLWRRWGRLPWADLVAPGLAASYGTPFPAAHAAVLANVEQAMVVGEGTQVYAHPDGRLLAAGETLRHPDHHRAFELLAADPDAFYRGAFAEAMVAAVADGGALDATDLAAYEVVERPPQVVRCGPGTVAARGDDLDGLLGTLHRAAELVTGDPTTDPHAALGLVSALRAPDRRAETTNLVAVDPAGNICGATTSLGLGSGVWVPGYGVHLNSMMGEGELLRGHVRPGERMGSMMSPLIVRDAADDPLLVAGAAGGSRIRPALVQTVLRVLGGQAPQEAIDAPRLNALPHLVRLEPGFAEEVIAALAAAGNEVVIAPHRASYFGGVSAFGVSGGGADPRRGGTVIEL